MKFYLEVFILKQNILTSPTEPTEPIPPPTVPASSFTPILYYTSHLPPLLPPLPSLRTGFGWVLVVFCVVRVVIASYNVVVRRDAMAWRAAQPDVATTAIRGINVALAG